MATRYDKSKTLVTDTNNPSLKDVVENRMVDSISDLEQFITGLNYEQSLFCLIECCVYAQKRGILTLEEAEVISKSIRKIHNVQE